MFNGDSLISSPASSGYCSDVDYDDLLSVLGDLDSSSVGDIEPNYSSPASSDLGIFDTTADVTDEFLLDLFAVDDVISPLAPSPTFCPAVGLLPIEDILSISSDSISHKRKRCDDEDEDDLSFLELPVKKRSICRALFTVGPVFDRSVMDDDTDDFDVLRCC